MKRTILAILVAAGAVVATPSFAFTQADQVSQSSDSKTTSHANPDEKYGSPRAGSGA